MSSPHPHRLSEFKAAARMKGIARHNVSRMAIQLRPSLLEAFEDDPSLMDQFSIELPGSEVKTIYTIDKMDAAGIRELFKTKN